MYTVFMGNKHRMPHTPAQAGLHLSPTERQGEGVGGAQPAKSHSTYWFGPISRYPGIIMPSKMATPHARKAMIKLMTITLLGVDIPRSFLSRHSAPKGE